jgi:type VII secretion-associated serine protease mycosin
MITKKANALLLVIVLLFGLVLPVGAIDKKRNVLIRFASQEALINANYEDITNGVLNIAKAELNQAEINSLKKSNDVLYAEPSGSYKLNFTPNDPLYTAPGQYYWSKIEANAALDISQGNGVVVAVLDSGVDLLHPDLAGQLVTGTNIVSPGEDPQDDTGHGTMIAGIIAAKTNNDVGVAGLAPQAKIMPVKIFDATGNTTDTNIINGITWAVNNGADVINMSFGSLDHINSAVRDTIEWAFDQGVILVAGAGNQNTFNNEYPAAYPQVISVGATDENDNRAAFSNYGSTISVVAPGVNIYSTTWMFNAIPQNTYTLDSGTSFSCPEVAAAAALLKSRYPDITPGQAKYVIEKTARDVGDPGRDDQFGWGVLDMAASLNGAPAVLATLPDAVDIESNDSKSSATSIVVNTVYSGNFNSAADTDWYKLSFTQPSSFTLKMTTNATTDAIMAVQDSSGTVVTSTTLSSNGGATTNLQVNNLTPGDYYVVFRQISGDPWLSGEQYNFESYIRQVIAGRIVDPQGLVSDFSTPDFKVTISPVDVPGFSGPDFVLTPASDGTFATIPTLPGSYRMAFTYPSNYLATDDVVYGSGVDLDINKEIWPGNVNGDHTINDLDIQSWWDAVDSAPDSPNWNADADINKDNIVDLRDLVLIAVNYWHSK